MGAARGSTMATAAAASEPVRGWGGAAARWASEGASYGGSGAGAAGFASSRRRGDPGVQLAAADEVGQARAEWEWLDMPG